MAENEVQNQSLQLVFDEIKGRIAAQDSQIATLDGKATVGFGSATLLAAVSGLQQATAKGDLVSGGKAVTDDLSIWAFGLYLLIIFVTLLAYRPRNYKRAVVPRTLRDEYLTEDERITREKLIDAMIIAYEKNSGKIKEKAFWTYAVVVVLLVQAVLIVVISARQYALF